MSRFVIFVYGLLSYLLFLGTFVYMIGFVWNFAVPRGIDDGDVDSFGVSLLLNILLMLVFAVQHSLMARPWFKRLWSTVVPQAAERSTYVLLASLCLCLLMWKWQAMPTQLWNLEGTLAGHIALGVSVFGWSLVLVTTFMINHFSLFGLSQVVHNLLGRSMPPADFVVRGPYKVVRHPLMLGFLLAFWATPVMSVGHLVFALGMTGYILGALVHEEQDLAVEFGDKYRSYQQRTSMLFPFGRR